MMRICFTLAISIFVVSSSYANNSGPVTNLYSAHRAMKVDDILTVYVVEEAKAGSESGTKTDKKNNLGAGVERGTGLLSFIPSMGASGSVSTGYDGKGSTAREGSLAAKISARVVQVLDNGNLVIDGSKVVEINQENEIIKVSGIVRPQDIEGNNIIYSCNIADAKITYSGKGVVNTAQRPGLLARLLNFIF